MIPILSIFLPISILFLAILLDLFLGDPSPHNPKSLIYRLHPAVVIGNFIGVIKPYFKNSNPKIAKLNGVLLGLVVLFTFSLPFYYGLGALFTFLHIGIYAFFAIIFLKFTICIKLETDWAKAAAKSIGASNLEAARKFAHFSRRNSTNLTGPQITSSVIESMAENLIDFKLSPILFYAFFGVTGAIIFKAINTLDGMVGFKDKEHKDIGWFSAKLDTVVNYIPTRFAALLIIFASFLIGENYRASWKIAFRDYSKTPSRNHGWPMAAMAGALNVQLEKPGQYILGDKNEELTPKKILIALKIRNLTILLFILFILPIIWFIRLFFFPF
ncbi:cobalamin biosynthesis protein [Candidatus Bathyarchaeota archaeon]|nr:cobalamin biosynthesis protein [Candidatus Bathyarchaeota archaeon]